MASTPPQPAGPSASRVREVFRTHRHRNSQTPTGAFRRRHAPFEHSTPAGKFDFEEEFHRSLSTPVIKDDIVYVTDFAGLLHCLNAKTGHVHWNHDLFAACRGSPLLVDDKVYVGDEDGDVVIFRHSADKVIALPHGTPLAELNLTTSIYSTPIVANNVLYIATKNTLYAIETGAMREAPKPSR